MQKLSQAVKNIRWLNSNKRTTEAFDSKSDTVTFTTADVSSDSSATSWTSVSQLTSGLTHATLLNRISAMMKNVRYLRGNIINNALDANVVFSTWNDYITYYNIRRFIYKAPGFIILNIYGTLKNITIKAKSTVQFNIGILSSNYRMAYQNTPIIVSSSYASLICNGSYLQDHNVSLTLYNTSDNDITGGTIRIIIFSLS